MKPSFALNLTSDSVGLLQRTAGGWQDVGNVPFDAPDLPAALGALRTTATSGPVKQLTTKIVVPNSQILYTEVTAPGPDNGSRRAQIRIALEGLTPYAVKELVFDWHGSGERVKVAVVARETLQEAEAFAEEHQFNPLSFVAAPSPEQFGKEPWFGTTAGAQKRLPKGEKVERDLEALHLGGPPAEAQPTETARSVPEVMAERFSDVMLPAEATPASPAFAATADEPTLPLGDLDPVVGQQDSVASTAAPTEPVADDLPEQASVAPLSDAPEFSDAAAGPDLAAPDLPPASEADYLPPPLARAPEKPIPHALELPPFTPPAMADDVRQRPQPSVSAPEIPEAPYVEVSEAEDQSAAFASRRAADGSTSGLAGRVGVERPADLPGRALPPRPPTKPFGAGPAPAPQRASGLSVTAPSIPGSRNRKPAKPASQPAPQPAIPPRPTPAASALPAAKTNSMGGFGSRQLPQRGKPRHLGLILTGMLLLVLAAIAAWASFTGSSTETAANTEITAPADASTADAVPGVDEEMLADQQMPSDLALQGDAAPEADVALPDETAAQPEGDVATELPAAPETVAAPESVAAPEAVVAAPVADTPAAEAPQVTEAASAALTTPPETTQDEIFLTAMDTPQPTLDAVALPDPPVAPDASPGAQMPPPPFGTVYAFDAAGMIVPTAEGIEAPGGFTLVAGPPPVKPPSRPAPEAPLVEPQASIAPPVADAAPTTTPGAILQTAPSVAAVETVPDPALANARPRSRPVALETAPATVDEDAALTAPDTQTATLRPRVRPAGLVPDVQTAQQAAQGATLMMAAAPAPRPDTIPDVAAAADGSISPLAISVSRRPASRPSDFSGAIEAAVAAAVQQPAAPAAAAIARVEPEEQQEEPEVVAAVAPRIPTRASVAQQATFANAINLSKINLIGVYGTSSNRYALVRQANGKYRRVSVGDRLDGGTVAAITTNELRYRKGSRMLALEMPRG